MLHLRSVTRLEGRVFGVRDRLCSVANGGELVGARRLAFRCASELFLPFEYSYGRSNGSTGTLSFAIVRTASPVASENTQICIFSLYHHATPAWRLLGYCKCPRLFVGAAIGTMDWRFIIAIE